MNKSLRLDRGQIEVLDDVMAEVLRHKTPAERIRIGFSLWTAAHDMLVSHLSRQHPEWNAHRLKEEVAQRFLHGAS